MIFLPHIFMFFFAFSSRFSNISSLVVDCQAAIMNIALCLFSILSEYYVCNHKITKSSLNGKKASHHFGNFGKRCNFTRSFFNDKLWHTHARTVNSEHSTTRILNHCLADSGAGTSTSALVGKRFSQAKVRKRRPS